MGKEDAISLRDECSATRGLVAGDPTTGRDAWSPSQLSRFLREPLIAGLHDQVGTFTFTYTNYYFDESV